jgi:coenzyme F420-0:L-glutamate ligase / coenzyme F420-1:gamma-L-glutamate ligase
MAGNNMKSPMTTGAHLELSSIPGIPMIEPGDDLSAVIIATLDNAGLRPHAGDVFVVAQKVVSKAEGRLVDLAEIRPSTRAQEIAAKVGKDARLVEVILSESKRIVRYRPDLIIVEHRLGFVAANAGVDQSNVDRKGGRDLALLLPHDPDASADVLRAALCSHYGCDLAVIISDSFGRAWRRGTVGVALGAAGLPALVDLRGQPDLFGRPLRTSIVGFADEIAAAASLLMGQGSEGQPVVLVRGLHWSQPPAPAQTLLRPEQEDLFR